MVERPLTDVKETRGARDTEGFKGYQRSKVYRRAARYHEKEEIVVIFKNSTE